MPSVKRAINYLLNNRAQFIDSVIKHWGLFLPDKLYLSLRFRCQLGYWIDWKYPKTFSEKLQWLKVYNRKLEYTTMVDKYAVKEYVAKKIGEQYLIPTLGVWNRAEDIEWDTLPERFVLKTTHGGGSCGVVICKNKSTFNKQQAIEKLTDSLKSDIYSNLREWPYKNVRRRIIAEVLIEEKNKKESDLFDYKFFCFNGEPLYCQVIRDRNTKETIDFYDMQWNHMPFVGLNPIAKNGTTSVAKPIHLDNMIKVCKKLAYGIPFLRIDLYVVNDKEYFGEITFYPASGMGEFRPAEWNRKIGEYLLCNK